MQMPYVLFQFELSLVQAAKQASSVVLGYHMHASLCMAIQLASEVAIIFSQQALETILSKWIMISGKTHCC